MPIGPVQTQVIFIPVPTPTPCAGVDYGRPDHPKPNRRHKAQRELWRPQRNIPQRPVIDRDLIERMREQARRTIANAKPTIEALLRTA
jgi:hypothetical protein